MGVKMDAVPGRLNHTWFKATQMGTYLWRMLRTVRRAPRLHADRSQGGERRRLCRLARRLQEEIRRARRANTRVAAK